MAGAMAPPQTSPPGSLAEGAIPAPTPSEAAAATGGGGGPAAAAAAVAAEGAVGTNLLSSSYFQIMM